VAIKMYDELYDFVKEFWQRERLDQALRKMIQPSGSVFASDRFPCAHFSRSVWGSFVWENGARLAAQR